jgi:hypothetical protein
VDVTVRVVLAGSKFPSGVDDIGAGIDVDSENLVVTG